MPAIVALPMAVGAQETADLARRLDSLRVMAEVHHAALTAYDRTHPSRKLTWFDSVTVAGTITIYSKENTADVGRATGALLDTLLRRTGTALAGFPPMMFNVRRDTMRGFDRRRMIILGYMPGPAGSMNRDVEPDPAVIARTIAEQATQIAVSKSRSEFSSWHRGAIPLGKFDNGALTDWGALRLELLSSSSVLGRRCYDGTIAACLAFAGLAPADDPVTAWYDGPARRREVEGRRNLASRFSETSTEQCLRGVDARCIEVLRGAGMLDDPPGTDSIRATLMRQAIAIGGAGSLERLLEARGSAADALAAAASVRIDSVVSSWRMQVHDSAHAESNLSLHIALVAIVWVAALVLLAVRTSRWP